MEELAHTMVRNPVRVAITPDKPAVERIDQKVLFVEKKKKDSLLASLLSDPDIKKVLVFTQMKHVANRVVKKLSKSGINGVAIHGNAQHCNLRVRIGKGGETGDFKATWAAPRCPEIEDHGTTSEIL